MKRFILLIKDLRFWLLLFAFIAVAFVLMCNFLIYDHHSVPWQNLPPLPNGETAREFTDVLIDNRINVLTDQGHYFRCPYHTPADCWIPIPRQINHPQSTNPGIVLPRPPKGTRQMVSTFFGPYDLYDAVLVAIIRSDGQVAFWQERVLYDPEGMRYTDGLGCGGLLIFIIVLMAALVRSKG